MAAQDAAELEVFDGWRSSCARRCEGKTWRVATWRAKGDYGVAHPAVAAHVGTAAADKRGEVVGERDG